MIWADVIQFTVYILGALVALYVLVGGLPGGWDRIDRDRGSAAGKFRVFDFTLDFTQPYTFWAGLFGGMVLNTATHGADQMMVQRYLAARSQRQAAGALIASGFVVLVQFALFLFIGSPCSSSSRSTRRRRRSLKPDDAFASFIVDDLPIGVKGLVIAAIFASAMGVSRAR